MNDRPTCKLAKVGGCGLTRRRFVQMSALGAAGTGGAIGERTLPPAERVAANFKATKEQAGYIEKSEPSAQDCGTCRSFIEPDDCVLVEGPVSPLGWCNWYSG